MTADREGFSTWRDEQLADAIRARDAACEERDVFRKEAAVWEELAKRRLAELAAAREREKKVRPQLDDLLVRANARDAEVEALAARVTNAEKVNQVLREALAVYTRMRSNWWGRFLMWLIRKTT